VINLPACVCLQLLYWNFYYSNIIGSACLLNNKLCVHDHFGEWLVDVRCLKAAIELGRRESLRQDERVAMSDERRHCEHLNASSHRCS